MTQTYQPDGETIERQDGSTVYPVVYLDEDGRVVDKAYIPAGHEPEVPDAIDIDKSETITADTDLSTLLPDRPANLPDSAPHDPAETAMEKLENIVRDETYKSDI